MGLQMSEMPRVDACVLEDDPLSWCAYLEDMPVKILWSTFVDHTFNFSMEFDEFKRPLTLVAPSFLVFSYSHHFKMHATTYVKLL